MDIWTIVIFGFILLAALLIPYYEGLYKNSKYIFISSLCLAFAFCIRAWVMDFESGDYTVFLTKWVDYFKNNGGFSGLKESIGNYNIPYLYFLALFSYSGIKDLYLIKLLSIAFDVVLAFAMMKLAGVFTDSKKRRLAAFLITLLLPTVILNGAKWGQCDSIYVSFALLALWLALDDRPCASMACMALSLGFKLQAVFLMPIYIPLLFAKKVKIRHFLVFPAVYILELLPAVIAGRPFIDALTLYFNQAETVGGGLNYNSPSVFALMGHSLNAASASAAAIAAAFIFIFVIFIISFFKRKLLGNEALMWISILFAAGIPFILPHMHDRYFYMCDVLTLLPAVLCSAYCFLPVFAGFASMICYHFYLTQELLYPLKYGSICIIVVLIIALISLGDKLNSKRFSFYLSSYK